MIALRLKSTTVFVLVPPHHDKCLDLRPIRRPTEPDPAPLAGARARLRTFQVDEVVYAQGRRVHLLLDAAGHIALGVAHGSRRRTAVLPAGRTPGPGRAGAAASGAVGTVDGATRAGSGSGASSRGPVGPACTSLIRSRRARGRTGRAPMGRRGRRCPRPFGSVPGTGRHVNPRRAPPPPLAAVESASPRSLTEFNNTPRRRRYDFHAMSLGRGRGGGKCASVTGIDNLQSTPR